MTTSIQAKQDIETRVAGWVQTYADTITKNYRDYHIRTLKGNLSGNYPEYAREQLDEIENGTANLNVFQGQIQARNIIKLSRWNLIDFGKMEVETLYYGNNTEMDQFTHLLIKKLVKFINLHHGKHPQSTLDLI